MQKTRKDQRPAAELPKGFIDVAAEDLQATGRMLETIRRVYHSYGFEPLETPALEYTEALGKFLPDQDRPNAGVFSFQDEDEKWMSLRYDLTAPLARYVAANFDKLPKPFRRYAVGPVWRNEKPGPGRYRQFTQFDADTVGTDSVAADAEICMLAADTMEALGVPREKYVVKVNNRKVLEGFLEASGLAGDANASKRILVMRTIDKADRLGVEGITALLGKGRRDESGDFTKGAELSSEQIERVLDLYRERMSSDDGDRVREFATIGGSGTFGIERAIDAGESRDMQRVGVDGYISNSATLSSWEDLVKGSPMGMEGIRELRDFISMCEGAGFGSKRIRIDSSVVRGLEYYTGPVFETELTFEAHYAGGQPVRFGSVGGGGRYDGLVERFMGTKVPATGFSIGVSRLQAALAALNKDKPAVSDGPVVVLVMDKGELPRYQKMAQVLRQAGIRAEMYLGTSGMKAQMKYADKRGSPCVVIQGGDEIAKCEVQIKDLIEGAKAAETIKDSKEWREGRPAQVSVPEAEFVEAVRGVLARHRST